MGNQRKYELLDNFDQRPAQCRGTAKDLYIPYQHSHGHAGLIVSPSGFHVSLSHPYLGASPDGAVYDPTNVNQPFGFIEVKCPYTARNMTPVEACLLPKFCCTLTKNQHGHKQMILPTSHQYYAQIQDKWLSVEDHGVTLLCIQLRASVLHRYRDKWLSVADHCVTLLCI